MQLCLQGGLLRFESVFEIRGQLAHRLRQLVHLGAQGIHLFRLDFLDLGRDVLEILCIHLVRLNYVISDGLVRGGLPDEPGYVEHVDDTLYEVLEGEEVTLELVADDSEFSLQDKFDVLFDLLGGHEGVDAVVEGRDLSGKTIVSVLDRVLKSVAVQF
jgi:hypothetical protein